LDPQLDGADRDWPGIYAENSRLLYREIDYIQEAKNCDLFRTNFAGTQWVKVPEVEWSRVSNEVITLEYVPGTKINDLAAIESMGLDRKLLAKRSADAYMTQLCRHGFFHCDPHPGNLAVDDAVPGGRLVFYDFGMMDEIPEPVRKREENVKVFFTNKEMGKRHEKIVSSS
jgi:predicted unusual protein kinase regulating ubiquinone biosynthesis (AarF/ABC1/UbiB family)